MGAKIRIAFSPNEELYCLWDREKAAVEFSAFPGDKVGTFEHHICAIHLRGHARWVGFMPGGKRILIFAELPSCPSLEERRQAIQIWNIDQKSEESLIFLPPDITCDMFDNEKADCRGDQLLCGPQHTRAFISPDEKILALGRRQPDHVEVYLLNLSDPTNLLKLIDLPITFPRLEPPAPLKYFDFCEPCEFIQFARSGTYITTSRGDVRLPGASPPFPLLFATRTWIQEDGEDIMAIPPEYQDSLLGINGHTITFRDIINGPLFVILDEGAKTMTP